MGVGFEESGAGLTVRLEGAVDIGCAAELKTVLLRALGACKDLSISVEAATYLDVTAVQLLWAAGEQARRSGVGFHIIGGLPEAIAAGLADAGFPAFLSTANAEQNRGV